VWMQIVHLLGADLYWIALVTLAAKVTWPKGSGTLLSQADHLAPNPPASPVDLRLET
jgi:hypothetical protein